MTRQAEAILRAVERIYESAFEPDAWSRSLDAVRDLVGGEHAVFQRSSGRIIATDTCSRLSGIAGHIARSTVDEYFLDHMDRLPAGPAATTQSSVMSMKEYIHTDFYNIFIRPIGGGNGAFAIPWRDASDWVSVAVCRPLHARDYVDEELRALDAILPHFAAAGRMSRQLAAAEVAVNTLGLGVILLDRRAVPVYLNEQAEAFAAARDGLFADGRGIAAATTAETKALHEAIGTAVMMGSGPDAADDAVWRATSKPIQLSISRRAPRCPLTVTIVPARALKRRLGLDFQSEVAILIADPSASHALGTEQLVARYGLTRREADLAFLIVDGSRLAEAATLLGISVGTARQYLKCVFEKTGTHGQTDLVRLVLRGY